MIKIKDLFEVVYGVNLELVNCIQTDKKNGIPFVSRTSKNNGVVAYIEEDYDLIPNPAHTISVAGSGSVLSSFYQEKPYYSGRDLYYLKPKVQLSVMQMLYYCMILQANKYRYNYGRQANKTLKNIGIPDVSAIPTAFLEVNIGIDKKSFSDENIILNPNNWKKFKYHEIFDIKNGYYNKKPSKTEIGTIPFIGATEYNNGITDYFSEFDIDINHKSTKSNYHSWDKKVFKPNCITVSNNGSIGNAFYQEKEFTCTHDVNVLYLKEKELNKYIAMFLCTLIELEKYRWDYGRKWRPTRMPKSEIKLPTTPEGLPDWNFMEKYIKTLHYSKAI